MNLNIFLQNPLTYIIIIFSIPIFAVIFYYAFFLRQRIRVLCLNMDQTYKFKRIKLTDGNKIKMGKENKEINPKMEWHNGRKTIMLYNNPAHEFLHFKEPDGKEQSDLLSTWTFKEWQKAIKKLMAEAKIHQKVIDTMPLIVIIIIGAGNLFLSFMIARGLHVF